MPKARRVLSFAFALCAITVPVFAANRPLALSDYIVTSWTMKDGLPSDVIWTMAQDREGNLWLGTNGGLGALRRRPLRDV